jgi:hypothetical protein
MVSFASSIHVDLDGGVAAFASINAMQGYRPVPVTQFAVQLMNASAQGKRFPQAPALPATSVPDCGDYAATYTSGSGKRIKLVADEAQLAIDSPAGPIVLERSAGDVFLSAAPEWEKFPLVFGRDKGKVVEMAYGSEWFTNTSYEGVRSYAEPKELEPFVGVYQSDSAWAGSVRVVLRKGKLWADGVTLLQPIGNALFRVGEEPYSPDTAQFCYIVEGKAQLVKFNGADLFRIESDL